MVIAAVLLLVGNWVRYAGSTQRSGGNVVAPIVGEILIGFAQTFTLSAPTRYSDMWFTNHGRIAATALPSLANPLGGALGQLINPFWVSDPGDISQMVLYISIIVCHSFFRPLYECTNLIGKSLPSPPSRRSSSRLVHQLLLGRPGIFRNSG